MADAIKAFLEFLIDLFSALAKFLGADADFDFENIINQYPGSFAVISSVNSTFGNFKKVK